MSVDTDARKELERQLAELRVAYIEKLPGKFEDLARLFAEARATLTTESADALMRCAHTLAGTAGSYGLSDVSQAARKIEELVGDPADERAPEVWERMDGALDAVLLSMPGAAEPTQRMSLAERPSIVFKGRLLVIDKDRDFLDHISALGGESLIRVEACPTREEGVAACESAAYDAALITIEDDDRGAFDTARELRSTPGNATLPLAFVSENSEVSSRVGAAKAGGLLFLSKPLSTNHFADAIQRLLRTGDKERPRVLVVDDDPDFVEFVSAILSEEGMAVMSTTDPKSVMEHMESFEPTLVLLDVVMPEVGGLDICQALRTSPRWQNIPVVFVTMKADSASRLETFRAGGDDYLPKPVLPEELIARVRIRVERATMLRQLNDRDPLSGLLLRRAFVQAAESRFAEAARLGAHLSIAILDLDKFKDVNDTQGHLAGDKVISAMGSLLQRRFHKSDLRARWGGEEFVLALNGVDNAAAKLAVSSVLKTFRRIPFGDSESKEGAFRSSFTAGIATFPADGDSLTELIRTADQRLYKGKAEGRARVVGDSD